MIKYWPVIYRTLEDAIAASRGAPMERDREGYLVVRRPPAVPTVATR